MSGPCSRPECGGEQHTDPWGVPVQCPHAEPVVQADTGRRCPRCDCPDGHEQCQHCKVCPHARAEPTPLTREQLEPIVVAVHRREGYARAGVGFLLPPFPACPTCGQSPTEMAVRQSERFIEDRVQFGFRPCGHTFTVDSEDLYDVYEAVRQRVAQEEAP